MDQEKYTIQEQLTRWEIRRELQNIMGRLSMDYTLQREASAYDKYWSRRDDVSLGLNDGYYFGPEAVGGYYAAIGRRIGLVSRLLQKKFPEQLGNKTDEEIYGVGMMTYRPLDTCVIEIAEDGLTAKGMWYCRGCYTYLTAGGPMANWEWSSFAVDFINEDGQWKIWHMLNLWDLDKLCGIGWLDETPVYEDIEEFLPIKDFRMPEPNVKITNRELYSAERPYVGTPEIPKPYRCFDETFSYGCPKEG